MNRLILLAFLTPVCLSCSHAPATNAQLQGDSNAAEAAVVAMFDALDAGEDVAWTRYRQRGRLSMGGQEREIEWIESAVLRREQGAWTVDRLQSINVPAALGTVSGTIPVPGAELPYVIEGEGRGEYDLSVTPNLWSGARTPFRNLTVSLFERSGHTPQLEEPGEFDRRVLRWLNPGRGPGHAIPCFRD